ncbi:hypothetical protein DES40_0661 [Litorimonas taeanensis]|uniref:Uncharacterized protein n=1 Tax=Litorimonas taeanensis TaxID=568099 RepID=A0A420WK10_9PROT|nr:hypothetical protein DES40_0661 [Litorimonas taeanensis]
MTLSWQSETQLQDMEPHERLHITCLKCSYQWYHDVDEWVGHPCHKYLFVDEIAKLIICPQFGCGCRKFRVAKPFLGDTEAFVGGMP